MSAAERMVETTLPAGDPAKPWWTYEDLAAVFGIAKVRHKMTQWEKQGFPAPLPYGTRPKRWHPPAVLGWKARFEIRHHARGLEEVRHD